MRHDLLSFSVATDKENHIGRLNVLETQFHGFQEHTIVPLFVSS
jgi:hypothetical protein